MNVINTGLSTIVLFKYTPTVLFNYPNPLEMSYSLSLECSVGAEILLTNLPLSLAPLIYLSDHHSVGVTIQ